MPMLLEIMRIGNFQKVVAVDEASGTEVSFMAPVSASRLDIDRLARAKLDLCDAQENPRIPEGLAKRWPLTNAVVRLTSTGLAGLIRRRASA
jgi:hypothetical protein